MEADNKDTPAERYWKSQPQEKLDKLAQEMDDIGEKYAELHAAGHPPKTATELLYACGLHEAAELTMKARSLFDGCSLNLSMSADAPNARQATEQHFKREMPGVKVVWGDSDREYPTMGAVEISSENLFMKTRYVDSDGVQHENGAFIVYSIATRTLHEYYRQIGVYPPEED